MAKQDIKIQETKGKGLVYVSLLYTMPKKKIKGQPTSDGWESWEGVQLSSPGAILTRLNVSWIAMSASPLGRGTSTCG
jgi:hypothetical protein